MLDDSECLVRSILNDAVFVQVSEMEKDSPVPTSSPLHGRRTQCDTTSILSTVDIHKE